MTNYIYILSRENAVVAGWRVVPFSTALIVRARPLQVSCTLRTIVLPVLRQSSLKIISSAVVLLTPSL